MWANSGTTNVDKARFIAYQKYIALCGIDALESWSDMRRLEVDSILKDKGYLSNNAQRAASLPNLMPYPQTEATTNAANVPSRSTDDLFTQKIFWQP